MMEGANCGISTDSASTPLRSNHSGTMTCIGEFWPPPTLSLARSRGSRSWWRLRDETQSRRPTLVYAPNQASAAATGAIENYGKRIDIAEIEHALVDLVRGTDSIKSAYGFDVQTCILLKSLIDCDDYTAHASLR